MRLVEMEMTINGRTTMPTLTGGIYHPHLRVQDGEYLEVSFVDSTPAHLYLASRSVAALMYEPEVDYSALVVGTPFDVLEGSAVVEFGRVLRGPFMA